MMAESFMHALLITVFGLGVGLILTIRAISGQGPQENRRAPARAFDSAIPVPAPSHNGNATAIWQEYVDPEGRFSFKYPPDWTIHRSGVTVPYVITVVSNGFRSRTESNPQVGNAVSLYVGNPPYPRDRAIGLLKSQRMTWLGVTAELQEYDYERFAIVLTAARSDGEYQLVMFDRIDLAAREVFLEIARGVIVH